MLLLISRLLTCYNGRNEELTEDDLSNLFLAYMLCCDERLAMNEKLPNNNIKAEEFVESYMPGCLRSNYYLDEIFLTFMKMGEEDFSNCRMAIDENQKDTCRFYDSLTLNPSHYQHDMDFLMMKEKPLIKTGPNLQLYVYEDVSG